MLKSKKKSWWKYSQLLQKQSKLGINILKNVKDFYNNMFKTLKETRRWKNLSGLFAGRINMWKWLLLNMFYRFNALFMKIPITTFTDEEKNSKIFIDVWDTNPEQKEHLKLCFRAIVVKTAGYWSQNRCVEQQNKSEDHEINPYSCSHLISGKTFKMYIGRNRKSH